jgi:hypothetical protein
VQPLTIEAAVERPQATAGAARITPSRRRAAAASRAHRDSRTGDRRSALRSLAAELSAAAADIDGAAADAPSLLPDQRAILSLTPLPSSAQIESDEAAAPDVIDFAGLRLAASAPSAPPQQREPAADDEGVALTGHAGAAEVSDVAALPSVTATQPHAAAHSTAATESGDAGAPQHAASQLAMFRAQADVLAAKYDAELAARTAAEQRLAAAEDELHFLRAEMQMVGQKRRRAPGRVRRALRLVTGRRRATLPAGRS